MALCTALMGLVAPQFVASADGEQKPPGFFALRWCGLMPPTLCGPLSVTGIV
jgi:hypothetical protein